MHKKTLFILAFLMAGMTTVFFYLYINNTKAQSTTTGLSMMNAIVAKESIPAYQELSADMFEVKRVAATVQNQGAIQNVDDVNGMYTVHSVSKGATLGSSDIKRMDDAKYLSMRIPNGYRAVTISSDLAESVSNLIEPGDMVDIVFAYVKSKSDAQPPNEAYSKTKLLLTNVPVVAVDRRMAKTSAKVPYAEYARVTLKVKPDEAFQLIEALQYGNLHLMLRPSLHSIGGDS